LKYKTRVSSTTMYDYEDIVYLIIKLDAW